MILKKAADLFSDWNVNSVRYCSFKSNEHLEEGLSGDTDLDILIDKNDYSKATELLIRHKYIQVEPGKIGTYPNVVNWYGMDEDTGILIHIHLHFELMTGKSLYKDYCLPWSKLFLDNAFLDDKTGLYLADPNMEYVLLCTRLIVKRNKPPKRNKIPADIVKELDYLKERIEEDKLRDAISKMYGTSDFFFDAMLNVRSLSDKDFKVYYSRVKKAMKGNQRSGEFASLMKSVSNRSKRKVIRFLNKKAGTCYPSRKRFIKGGISVAFTGIDGSGKSTVCSLITKWLSEEFDTVKFYAGAGDGKKDIISSILLKGYKTVKKPSKDVTIAKMIEDDPAKRTFTFKQKIKGIGSSVAYNRILKSNIKALKKSVRYVKDGMSCVMDRYPQNSMPYFHDGAKVRKYDTGKGLLHSFSEKERRMLNAIKDYPYDIVFRMVVPAEVSYERKPEESLESLRYKAETLQQVVFDAKKTINIDASMPLDNVVLEVKKEIWNTLALR